jgi:hypothetical protein
MPATMTRLERAPRLLGWLLAAALVLVIFPPFHIQRLQAGGGAVSGTPTRTQDMRQLADEFWNRMLTTPATRSTDAQTFLELLNKDTTAAEKLGHTADLGGRPYYFLAGHGRVVATDSSGLWLDAGNAAALKVLLLTGPIFGNALRDATGLLPMGDLSFAQFNTLSSELDRLAEAHGEAPLRVPVAVGSSVTFVAAGEIDDSGGAPVLQLVPVQVTVQ